jgi:hypothetical protein
MHEPMADMHTGEGRRQNVMKKHALNVISKEGGLGILDWKSISSKALKMEFLWKPRYILN